MGRHQAEEIADALGGDAVLDEGADDPDFAWLVMIERTDGRLVVVSDGAVDEYGDREAFASGCCYASISLR